MPRRAGSRLGQQRPPQPTVHISLECGADGIPTDLRPALYLWGTSEPYQLAALCEASNSRSTVGRGTSDRRVERVTVGERRQVGVGVDLGDVGMAQRPAEPAQPSAHMRSAASGAVNVRWCCDARPAPDSRRSRTPSRSSQPVVDGGRSGVRGSGRRGTGRRTRRACRRRRRPCPQRRQHDRLSTGPLGGIEVRAPDGDRRHPPRLRLRRLAGGDGDQRPHGRGYRAAGGREPWYNSARRRSIGSGARMTDVRDHAQGRTVRRPQHR